jgi:hypothetical protein
MFGGLRPPSPSLLSPGGRPPVPPETGSARKPRGSPARPRSVAFGHLPHPRYLPGGRPPVPPETGSARKPRGSPARPRSVAFGHLPQPCYLPGDDPRTPASPCSVAVGHLWRPVLEVWLCKAGFRSLGF